MSVNLSRFFNNNKPSSNRQVVKTREKHVSRVSFAMLNKSSSSVWPWCKYPLNRLHCPFASSGVGDASKNSNKDFKEILKKKLNDKKLTWTKTLEESVDIDDFINRFENEINDQDTKFKFPWSMHSTQDAIDHCLFDLEENKDLEKNFDELQIYHYSSK